MNQQATVAVAAPVIDPRANEAASSSQTWALRLATGVDYRGKGLTRGAASALLDEANKKSGYVKKGKPKGSRAIEAAEG